MHIETGRLVIRNFTLDDFTDLQQILGDDETMRYCEPAYPIEKTADFLEKFCIDKRGAVAAVHKQTNKMIGYILFNAFNEDVYEIGWIFNKHFWGQGYALEACRAVIDFAFDTLRVHKVFAETIDRGKSVNLMKKLGMNPEGIQRHHTKDCSGNRADLYLYGMFAEDRP